MNEAVFADIEDDQDAHNVLVQLIERQPTLLRLTDLVRELGDPQDFSHSDGVERAVAALERVDLVFREGSLVLPTPSALRAFELLRGQP